MSSVVLEYYADLWQVRGLRGLDPTTEASFVRVNSVSHDLKGRFPISPAIRLWATKRVAFLPEAQITHPSAEAWIACSAAGLSVDADQALVYFMIQRGPHDHSGNYYLLERAEQEWQVVDHIEAWVT